MMLLASTAMVLLASMYDQSKFLRAEDLTAAKTFVPMLACAYAITVSPLLMLPLLVPAQVLCRTSWHPTRRIDFLAWVGCDFRRFGRSKWFSFSQRNLRVDTRRLTTSKPNENHCKQCRPRRVW